MYVYSIDNKKAYFDLFVGPVFRDRYLLERYLEMIHQDQASFTVPGICMPCQKPVDFLVDRKLGGRIVENIWRPNWRERQVCPLCGLASRQRVALAFVANVIHQLPRQPPTIYITEQTTPAYKRLKELFPEVELIGSEYMGPDIAAGTVNGGVRHEDLQKLGLASDSVDLLITTEVAEHVPCPEEAFREMHRVLRRGGQVFMTTPFACDQDQNLVRAVVKDGKIVHHLPETYHGNPFTRSGSLVFTDFGWEILTDLREAGFAQASLKIFWSYQYGHLGIPQEFFHMVK